MTGTTFHLTRRGLLTGAAALAALLLYRESLPRESRRAAGAPRPRRVNMLLTRPVLARFILVMFVMITAQAMLETIFGLWADATLSWGPRQVGWALAGLGVGAVLLQGGGAGRAARMLGERVTLLIGIASMIAGFAGMAGEELSFIGGAVFSAGAVGAD